MRNKTRRRGGGGKATYSIKNRFTTLEAQCGNINPKNLPYITHEDDFHRSIVFFKALKDKHPISLAKRALPIEEEDAFVGAWKASLDKFIGNDDDISTARVNWSIYDFLGLPQTVTEEDVRIAYLGYAHGIEQSTKEMLRSGKVRPENNALAAFGCKMRANTRQGEFRRYLNDILMPKRVREYGFDAEKFRAGAFVSDATGYDTPHMLNKATILITGNPDRAVITAMSDFEAVPYKDTLYIFTDTVLKYEPAEPYRVTASDLPNLRLLQDLIRGDHILDIHPRLLFLMYTDARARPLLDQIFGGSLPRGRLQFQSDEQAAFFWALCWEYYHNPRTLKKYLDVEPFYSASYARKWALIDQHYRGQTIDDSAIARILETTDWAMRGKGTVAAQRKRSTADRTIFQALYAQLPRPTDSELQANVYKYIGPELVKRGISTTNIEPYFTSRTGNKRLSKRSIHNMSFNESNDENKTFRWSGGAMPDFYKYYLPELTAAPTTCKLPASTKALEKIPALSLEQMFKRALLFWKRVQDGIPVPVNERALPAAEEEAFITAWQGAIADRAADEEAASLQFLRATEATKAQYESEFNNVAMPLSAFDCKRRPDASLSFNRLIGYIQKTGAERQYAFEANVLGAEFGTLAAGAVGLSTVAFVSDREAAVQTVAGKTAVAAPASETLFVQVAGRQGKPYILPGTALLKASLPRAAFAQRAVIDLHPKVAYFLWKDPKLRNELLLPCFGEAFVPSFRAVHKSLKGYEDEFAAVYYQLCYDVAHWSPSGKLAKSNAAYYGGRVPGAGVFPTPYQSPRGSIVDEANMITRSSAVSPLSVITSVPVSNSYTKTPADFYRLPNREKYAKIILFLQAHPDYELPTLQWTAPKRGFFSRLFTRKRKPIMNVLRNLKKQPANKTNSRVLEMLFTEEQSGRMVLQNGGRRRVTRRIRR